jgi:hypothetical protein
VGVGVHALFKTNQNKTPKGKLKNRNQIIKNKIVIQVRTWTSPPPPQIEQKEKP